MEIAARPGASTAAWPRRYSFLEKAALAGILAALADNLFFFQRAGSTLGLFALALLAAALFANPAARRSGATLAAAAAAFFFTLALADDPSLLAAALFWAAAASAVLLPRARFDHGLRWALRLLTQGLLAPVAPAADLVGARRARRRLGSTGIGARLPVLVLPLAGSALFLALFAAANPLIGDAFGRLDALALFGGLSLHRLFFWALVLVLAWTLLRPRFARLSRAEASETPAAALPGVSRASVTLSLLAFNAVFALQNGLDLAFLWSGARLPDGMTLAEYAHRGAYPLIATALLAGLFVLVTLRPGSDTAESRLVRGLVYVWIGQNVLLVASTILRTLDYVDVYSLTRLRIAALLWMALVAVGLVLVCWRLARGKSGAWLINANFAAAALVLAGASVVDLGAVAAQWNVRHAREAGGRGAPIDLCYLNRMHGSALLPLLELESRPLHPTVRERVSWVRNVTMDRLATQQGDWRGWTFRDHRRLAEAERRVAERGLPRFAATMRDCAGRRLPAQPLTAAAEG